MSAGGRPSSPDLGPLSPPLSLTPPCEPSTCEPLMRAIGALEGLHDSHGRLVERVAHQEGVLEALVTIGQETRDEVRGVREALRSLPPPSIAALAPIVEDLLVRRRGIAAVRLTTKLAAAILGIVLTVAGAAATHAIEHARSATHP